MKKVLMAAALLAVALPGFAQDNARGNASATLGGKKVTIDYGRPALKGRSMDELLAKLPADRMWRAGSGPVTTLTSETDILIGGKKVAAGKYTLYLHVPASGDYALAINKDLGVPLGEIFPGASEEQKKDPYPRMDYSKAVATEVARVALRKAAPAAPSDQFTIGLTPSKTGAVLALTWGDRSWTVDIAPAK